MRYVVAFGALLTLAACEVPMNVHGSMEDGSETFTGTATRYVDGGVTLSITGSKGLTCTGLMIYQNHRTGRGTLNCSDGRSGPFDFLSTGKTGTGTGHIGSQPFTFTFG